MSEQFNGTVDIRDAGDNVSIRLDGDEGDVTIWYSVGGVDREVLKFKARNAALYIGSEGNEGDLVIRDGGGRDVLHFDSNYAALYLGAAGNEGDLILRNNAGEDTFKIDGNQGDLIAWRMIDGVKQTVMHFDASHAALYVGSEGNEGDLIIRDADGTDVFHFDSHYAALKVGGVGNEGDIIVRDANGNNRIHLDGGSGDVRLQGADCAEQFQVAESSDVLPGTVLVIDEADTLAPCSKAYDKRVAGVVSGDGGLTPGIVLGAFGSPEKLPVALNGTVFCRSDASYAPIQVGDLLTTSATPGHAMKADDQSRAFGTVLGKALRGLESGSDSIPILVSLQ